jgi:type I restriction enzyme M protein
VSTARGGKPKYVPATPYGPSDEPLQREDRWVWAPLRKAWLEAKQEELVRQEFIYRLHTQWGYLLEQMRQEVRTQHGHDSPRADVVVAESPEALSQNRDYRIAVETKAENVTIVPKDYGQGESYGRAVGAEFLVMHNNKETAFFRLVVGAPGERIQITGIPASQELNDTRRLGEIRRATKAFTRDEFQRLLFECHSILRDNHKMDPGAAFDEISKILFIKMAFERMNRAEVFATSQLDAHAKAIMADRDDPTILKSLFRATREYYRAEQLFTEEEDLKISIATFRRIVKLLERFNLSDTGDDIKGIAFERFLGQTFRGELGQFFTPRPIVDFMVEILDPQEGELVCDPASGTGGFLIKAFEHVRHQIESDVESRKDAARSQLARLAQSNNWSADELSDKTERAIAELNGELDLARAGSRLSTVSRSSIYGADAAARAARTSKMNMIMHGDGHGGIHYHDGLLDTNGIFPDRFRVVITNPPFGSTVAVDQIVGATEQTQVVKDLDVIEQYQKLYGSEWAIHHEALREAEFARRPILELFDIGRDPIGGAIGSAKIRPARSTEHLFLERCIRLLQPGGRMGIVLPDGALNNPTNAWLREYVESCARLDAVVSIPQDVFASAKATVKTSLVFLHKFSDEETDSYKRAVDEAEAESDTALKGQWDALRRGVRLASVGGRLDLLSAVDELADLELASGEQSRERVVQLRRQLRDSLTAADRAKRKELEAENRKLAVKLAEEQRAMSRRRVKQLTAHPVFMAEVESAGITATGDTGAHVPNELPSVLNEYRQYCADRAAYAAAVDRELSGGGEQGEARSFEDSRAQP